MRQETWSSSPQQLRPADGRGFSAGASVAGTKRRSSPAFATLLVLCSATLLPLAHAFVGRDRVGLSLSSAGGAPWIAVSALPLPQHSHTRAHGSAAASDQRRKKTCSLPVSRGAAASLSPYRSSVVRLAVEGESAVTAEAAATAAEPNAVRNGGAGGLAISTEWEVDCYSRPVVVGGRKLWELLITDANGQYQVVIPIPANKVNSREVRAAVLNVIEEAPVRPKQLRFFRRAMFNMLNIALKDIAPGVALKPSRSTYALYSWLDERNANVYPKMKGYKPAAAMGGGFLDISTPQKLPDAMRADQFAFVSLPLSEVMAGGDVTNENIGVGKLCPIPQNLDPDTMLSGILFITRRAENLGMWLAGSELAHVKADLKRRELVMEVGLSTRYLTAKLTDDQRIEAQAFEASKARLRGLHFIGVQKSPEDDEVAGFWLVREMPEM